MPTYKLVTLGCKVNRADAAQIERALQAMGARPAYPETKADLAIVCGCAVTAVAEGKSRRMLMRQLRENPGAAVIAAGCIASRMGGCAQRASGVLIVRGGPEAVIRTASEVLGVSAATIPARFPGRTRAFIKVQDGCDGSCAYCIVPSLRGRPESKSPGQVLEEAARLVEAGHAEIVLVGVRLGRYAWGLARLAEELLKLRSKGLLRLRLSSVEPGDFDERLIELASSPDGICPHFHLPLQSADDEVLARMRRPYRVYDFRALVGRIRSCIPDVAITTDIIAGFPGETRQAHERTLRFVEEMRFARVHVFPFSPRPGTEAWGMPLGPAEGASRSRAAELIAVGELAAREYRSQFLGRVLEVLAEPGPREGMLSGYTERYAKVNFAGAKALVGKLVRVKAFAHARHGFEGELLE